MASRKSSRSQPPAPQPQRTPARPRTKPTTRKEKRARRRELAEQRRLERIRDRRRSWLIAGSALLAAAAIIGGTVAYLVFRPIPLAKRQLADFGVGTSDAKCSAIEDVPVQKGKELDSSSTTKPSYHSVPPTSGDYVPQTSTVDSAYYPPSQTTAVTVPELVGDERQGAVVVWYDANLAKDKLKMLSNLGTRLPDYNNSIIVAPWDSSYGSMPAGKQFVFATFGHRQACAQFSGKALQNFRNKYDVSTVTSDVASKDPAPTASAPPGESGSPAASGSPSASAGSSASVSDTASASASAGASASGG